MANDNCRKLRDEFEILQSIRKELRRVLGSAKQTKDRKYLLAEGNGLKETLSETIKRIDRMIVFSDELIFKTLYDIQESLHLEQDWIFIVEDGVVKLDAWEIGPDGARQLGLIFGHEDSPVKKLDLSLVSPSQKTIKNLIDVLKEHENNIREITENVIDSRTMPYLVDLLKSEKNKIRVLKLKNNGGIGDRGAGTLCQALTDRNNKVEYLDLANSRIENLGTVVIAETLEDPNNKIKTLILRDNFMIGPRGLNRLLQALGHPNCKVEKLDIRGTDFDIDMRELFWAAEKQKGRKVEIIYSDEQG